MALHPEFPTSPHAILVPDIRWYPGDAQLGEQGYQKLLPPLVHQLRRKVKEWRDRDYEGATETSKALLHWWFENDHLKPQADGTNVHFQYFYAQREAIETIIYLYDVAAVQDKYDLMRYDSSGAISASMFDEDWLRFVIKMATGAGKTKVMSLVLAWCYFHKLYEDDSALARNFLLITPNIIVLDRIRADFDGLKIFYHDPVLPDNGYEGRNWRDDFQLTLHIQDNVHVTNPAGNIFLTNIHRVYDQGDDLPSKYDENTMDYFLGQRPKGDTKDASVDLDEIVRDIEEIVVINDEAHHVHNDRLAWFKSIEDIHNNLKHKDKFLSLQIDVTATPKHNNGAIFVQTVSDYPLVEAIQQNVVKHPVLPDQASRAQLSEKQSSRFTEKYEDYLHLGVEEWRKAYAENEKAGKKSVLFVMTDDTKNCDEVAEWLERNYAEFQDAVLTIHTNKSGEIAEKATSGKKKEELDRLREQANEIDSWHSPYKAIVSVLVLKEGWDVRNVTTIVGLRSYSAKSNILPEQTLGRGLRKMHTETPSLEEFVSVVGTDAFMDFVESIQNEGVELERTAMGEGTKPKTPVVVEVDNENEDKDLDKMDIPIPHMAPRMYREFKNLEELDPSSFGNGRISYKEFSPEEQKEITFRDVTTDETTHKTVLNTEGSIDATSAIGYFAKFIMRELRLFSGYDILYGCVKDFVKNHLFDAPVDLDNANTLRNLAEPEARSTIIETFKKEINALTVQDSGSAEIRDYIKLRNTRPFVTSEQKSLRSQKSVFNKVVGDNELELEFAAFLENSDDITSYAKNYMSVGFCMDYINAEGDIANYYPDFLVKKDDTHFYVIETKGREDVDVPRKTERLKQWCEDINSAQDDFIYDFVYVDQESFEKYKPSNFAQLANSFTQYK